MERLQLLFILLLRELLVEDAVFFVIEVAAEEAVRAAFQIDRECAVGTIGAVVQEERVVAVLGEETFVQKLASVDPEAVDAVLVLGGIGAIETIFLVVAAEREVAVLVGERVVRVFAVLGLLVDDGEARSDIEERLQLLEERNAVAVGLPEFQRVPLVAEEAVVAVDGEGDIRRVHGHDVFLAEAAGALVQAPLVAV